MLFWMASSRNRLKPCFQKALAGLVSLDGFLRGRVPVKFGTGHVPTLARDARWLAVVAF